MNMLLRKNQELSAILHISRLLTSSFDLEKNLNAVMASLADRLEMQRGCVFLLDPLSKRLQIVAAYGLTFEEIQRGKYRIGEGIVGRVIETGSPMFVPDIGEEPKFLNRTESRPRKRGGAFLCIPISLDGTTLGVISVDRIYTEKHGNVDDDLRVLSIVASFIGQFVKLWEHFRQTEKEMSFQSDTTGRPCSRRGRCVGVMSRCSRRPDCLNRSSSLDIRSAGVPGTQLFGVVRLRGKHGLRRRTTTYLATFGKRDRL